MDSLDLLETTVDSDSLSNTVANVINEDSVVVSNGTASISGTKFNDINSNGVRDSELVRGSDPDVVFAIDTSSSTGGAFIGSPVGDLNEDNREDRILDAEIAGFNALNQQLIEQGLGDSANVVVINFASNTVSLDLNPAADGVQLTTTPNADNNNNGILDIEEALASLRSTGGTNFQKALSKSEESFITLGTEPGNGNLIFLSDGKDSRNIEPEVERLNGLGVNISAFGVGENASLTNLQTIDPDAEVFTSTDELLAAFGGISQTQDSEQSQGFVEPGLEGITVYLDLNNNSLLDEGEPSQITNQNGEYSFTGLATGSYTVREVIPSGSTQTAPADGQFAIDLEEGEVAEGINFGNIISDDSPESDGIIQGQNLIVDSTGIVGSVDLITGELTEILDTNIALTDIDVDSDGNVFGIDFSQLYSIDLEARTTTPIGSYGVSVLNALEIGEDDTLYATGFSQDVFTIDSGTGEATSIGTSPINIQSAGDLQFINGTLYLSDTEDLIALDVSGGTLDDATVVGSFNLQGESIWGITIDEDGDAVGLTNNGNILNLDIDTGKATSIGTVENNTAINGAAALPRGFLDNLSTDNDEGLSIQLQVFSPNLETPISEAVTTTIDGDVEFDALPSIVLPGESLVDVNIDITQEGEGIESIFFEVDPNETFTSFASGEFNGYVFTDISDRIPAIENVTIDESTNTLGLEAGDVTFTENSIEVNVESLAFSPGSNALVNVEFADI